MLHIGMIGPDFLLQRNREIFQQQQVEAFAITSGSRADSISVVCGWSPIRMGC